MKKFLLVPFTLLATTTGALHAQTAYTWTGASNNVWNTDSNWSPSTGDPNTLGDTATFDDTATGPRNVNIGNLDKTIGNGANSILVTGSGYSLTDSTPSGFLTVDSNSATANNTININGATAEWIVVGPDAGIIAQNSDATGDGAFARFRIRTGDGASLQWNGFLNALTSIDIRTNNTGDQLTFGSPSAVNIADNRGVWFSQNAAGAGMTLSGSISASGTGAGTFVELAADGILLSRPNGTGPAIDASIERTGITGSATVVWNRNDQIASNLDTVNTAVGVIAGNRTLDLQTYDNTNTGTLELSDGFTLNIDFSEAGSQEMWFANSANIAWDSGATLNLIGFVFSSDQLRFGTNSGGLTSEQLSQITVDGRTGDYGLDSSGYLVVVPEPGAGVLLLSGLGALLLARRRR